MINKKNGRVEKFSVTKLKNSIKRAAKEAKIPQTKINKIVKEIANPLIEKIKKKDSTKSEDIRKQILKDLDKKAKPVANAWKSFEKRK